MNGSPKKTRPKGRFILLAASTLICFFAAEGVCRLLGMGNPAIVEWGEQHVHDEEYCYQPGSNLVYLYPDNPRGYFDENNVVLGHINAKGFRGKEVEFEKPPGTTRIAFIGDSFTLGIGVRDEDTFPACVERLLKKDYSHVEALNFGVSGFSTQAEIKFLEEYAYRFEPDIVVIVYFLNDANLAPTIGYMSRPKYFTSVREHSYLVNAVFGAVERLFLHREMIRQYRDGYREDNPGWESVKTGFGDGQLLAEEYGFQLIVAIYPVLFHLDDRYPFTAAHEKIRAFCASRNIPCVDLLSAFRGEKDTDLWVHRTDQHPNEKAHRLAARELCRFFREQQSISAILGGS